MSKNMYFSFFRNKFIYFWLHWVFVAAHGLSLAVASWGPPLAAVPGPLTVVASPTAEHGLQAQGLQ